MTRTPLRKADPSVVDDDPFWATVVARHADATYVLLPPDPPPDEVPPGRVEGATTAVAETCRLLQRYVEAADPTATPALSWRGAPGERRLVARTALIGIGREAGTELAAAIGVALGERGWTLRAWRGAALATLALRSPSGDQPLEVDLAIGEGATVLSVTADPAVTSWR